MKALQRTLVTGPAAGLAVLTAASSGAFACTAQAGVKALVSQKSYVAPGETFKLEMQNFFDSSEPGNTLVRVILRSPEGSELLIDEKPGPKFEIDWQVPGTVRSDPNRLYAVEASQFHNGERWAPPGALLMIANDADVQRARPTTTTSPTSLPTSTSAVPPPLKDVRPSVLPEPIGSGIGSARAMAPSLSSSPPAAPGGVLAVDPGSAVVAGTPSAALDAGAPPPEDRQAPALAGIPQLPAESLWSGLDGDGGASPSLLDAPPAGGGGGPLGGILFGGGAGLLALTGLALGASRRRLALARR